MKRRFWFGYNDGNVVFWVLAHTKAEVRAAAMAAGLGRPDWIHEDKPRCVCRIGGFLCLRTQGPIRPGPAGKKAGGHEDGAVQEHNG